MIGPRIEPHGLKDARIVMVGEAPGQQEEIQRRFFVGPAGQLEKEIMWKTGIGEEECYWTNVSKERPPGNDFRARYYHNRQTPTQELLDLHGNLIEELKVISPNVTVAVGNEALYALTGRQGINVWRGSILDSPVGKVIPVIHPAALLRAPDKGKETYALLYAASLFDFAKIRGDSRFPELRLPTPNLVLSPTFQQVQEVSRLCQQTRRVAIDIETTNNEIDCLAISPTPDYSICIPFFTPGTNQVYWSSDYEVLIWRMLAELMGDPEIAKIFQNANYDVTYLERSGCILRNLRMDTMNAHHVCYPGLLRSLEFQTSIYTRYPYYKDQNRTNRWRYNALDGVVTRTIADVLDQEMRDLGVHNFYYDLVNQIVLPYKEVADTGINIDAEEKARITTLLESELRKITVQLADQCGIKFNPRSPKQMTDVLYKDLGLPLQRSRDTGKPTGDKDALKRILKMSAGNPKLVHLVPFLETLLEFSSVAKLLSTYARAEVDPDGRIRTTYSVSGAETGRLASHKAITETGANLQNIPKGDVRKGCGFGIRSFFVPDTRDCVFIEGDLSGADARVVAWESRDPSLVAIFNDPARDIHVENAAMFYGVSVKDITKDDKRRQIAKRCGHAANYGSGPRVLATDVGIAESEAKRLLAAYHAAYPGVRQWQAGIQQQLRANRTLVTPLGRKRIFFGRWGDELFKEAYAYVPQSTVADVIHFGFLALYHRIQTEGLDKVGVRVALNIHDAIVCNVPIALSDRVLAMMKECMSVPLKFSHGTYVIPVDFSAGPNWYEMKKVKHAT